jgi:CBS domain-containing protein
MPAKDVMNTRVTMVAVTATLLDAARMMVNARLGILPVVDGDGALVGILSEHDVLGHEAAEGLTRSVNSSTDAGGSLSAQISSVMTKNVVMATEEEALADVAALMVKHRVKHIPVVRGRSVVGVISRLDLLKAMLSPGPAPGAKQDRAPAPDSDAVRENVVAAIHKLGLPLGAAFDIVVRNGIVHLWGQVADQEQEIACRRATAGIPGVVEVMSHMQVIARRQRPR